MSTHPPEGEGPSSADGPDEAPASAEPTRARVPSQGGESKPKPPSPSSPQPLRAIVEAHLAEHTELPHRERTRLTKLICRDLAVLLVAEGFPATGAAKWLGYSSNIVHRWRGMDPEWAAAMDAALAQTEGRDKRRFRELLWAKAETFERGVPGGGQAINILGNLLHPELRQRDVKLDAKVSGSPSSRASRENLLQLAGRGED